MNPPTISVEQATGEVWLHLRDSKGRDASINMNVIGDAKGPLVGDIIHQWCEDVRDDAEGSES